MSAVISNTVVSENQNVTVVVEEKKPRSPILPAKFSKFIQFGFFLINRFKDEDGNFSVDNEQDFIDAIHLFDSIDAQQAFVQDFFDDSKNIAKSIRKIILDKKRAENKAIKAAAKSTKPTKEPKAPKEKVVKEPKAPKEKVVKEPKEKVVKEPKEKVVKAPKAKVVVPEVEVVVPVIDNDTVLQPVVSEKPKKATKSKKSSVVDDNFVAEVVSLANSTSTNNDKPKRKYNKKSNSSTTTEPLTDTDTHPEPEPETEPELSVSVFEFQGKNYLIDDLNRVFDFHSHNLIGHFSHNSLSLI